MVPDLMYTFQMICNWVTKVIKQNMTIKIDNFNFNLHTLQSQENQ
jgi:hypothetical protein